jgi:hypothetical protein
MRWWRPAVIACAALLALAPLPPALVERWYSTGAYPPLQHALTAASNLVPFSLFDVLIVLTIGGLVVALVADVGARRTLGWLPLILRTPFRLLTAGALLALAFFACWGLNYRREPVRDRLAFDGGRVSPRRARDLALTAVDRVNALYPAAHAAPAEAFEPPALEPAFAEAEKELGVRHLAVPARPKRTLLDWYFRKAGVDGMTDPYFLETLVVTGLFPFERPFIVAHEWGHLAGFADESEANFIGWLACIHGSDAEQYSGWLYLYSELAGGLRRADRIEVSARLADGARADLRAVSQRVLGQRNQTVSNAGWRVYDQYLKANHVDAGTASYAQVVQLVLGSEFDAEWRPKLR